jgi:peroxiredoxin Q/BCP
VRELREFRAHHHEFVEAGVVVAGVSRDPPESNLHWAQRLALPYPVLSDRDGVLGAELGVTRTLRIGPWKVDFLRRSTLLVGVDGRIAAAWFDVKVHGHAQQVLEAARALRPSGHPSP